MKIILVDLLNRYSNLPSVSAQLTRLAMTCAALPGVTASSPDVSSVPPRSRHKVVQRLDPTQLTALVAAYAAGATATELARTYRLSRSAVMTAVRHAGVPVRQRGLDEQQASEAVRLYDEGWSLARLGERYDVDDMTVRRRLLAMGVVLRGPHERRSPRRTSV